MHEGPLIDGARLEFVQTGNLAWSKDLLPRLGRMSIEHQVHEQVAQLCPLPRAQSREALYGVLHEVLGARHCDEYGAVSDHALRRCEDFDQRLGTHRAPRWSTSRKSECRFAMRKL